MFGFKESNNILRSKDTSRTLIIAGLVSKLAFSVLFIGLLACFIYSQVRENKEAEHVRETYVQTEATVSSCQGAYVKIDHLKKLDQHQKKDNRLHYITTGYKAKVTQEIELTYTYEGQEYTAEKTVTIKDSTYDKKHIPTKDSLKEETASQLYKVGDTMQVYVNPEAPETIWLTQQ